MLREIFLIVQPPLVRTYNLRLTVTLEDFKNKTVFSDGCEVEGRRY